MLLQRPPGDPVTPNDFITPYKEDNKENGATEQPLFGQPDFNYKTTGKQTSPDLVPVKQNKMHPVTTGAITCVPPSFSTTNTKSTTRAKPVVRFAPTDRKTEQAVTMATPLPQLNTQSQSMFSPAQMSEITQLLGLYSSATTPTGETKVAADNLLRYLKGANAPFDDKASFQPSIASSPLKQPIEKVSVDSSFLNSSATSVGKRRLNSKSFPAWR
uniref:Uncharacterized protein n=1 Tax=Ciona savignyi TaxID=51511 RepID=H2YQF3_CIOSA